MKDEISEEAKKSLANAARQAAFRRLDRAGAHSTAALQRRVRALAQERGIPEADYRKLMFKRPNVMDIGTFCEKYKISYDWILGGDLRGLKRMTHEGRAAQPEISEAERKEVISLYCALSPKNQAVALGCMRELLAKHA